MKQKKRLIIGLGSLTAVALIATAVVAIGTQDNKESDDSIAGINQGSTQRNEQIAEESATYKKYVALKGEDYDEAFVSNMIVHHEGAVSMAEMAGPKTSRPEIQDLAFSIITSQSTEIASLRVWQEQWGYQESSGHMMIGDDKQMMHDMAEMATELENLSGADFDKKFLELMIIHHQDAIDMSKPAAINASHQEVKTLAKAIIEAQMKEIAQMKDWQTNWAN